MNIHPTDIEILRDLFRQKRDIAQDPVMQTRKQLWSDHAALNSRRPMILAETSGVLDQIIPLSSLRCTGEWARRLERELRELIYRSEHVRDDHVVEPWIEYAWEVTIGDYGVEVPMTHGSNEGRLGSYHWEAPIRDLDRDFGKLRFQALAVDREKTAEKQALLEAYFGDILPVRLRASYWWTTGLTWDAILLVGLQPFMLAMYDCPQDLHRLMAFLRDNYLHRLDWFESEGLFTLNNENDYVGSGSEGYTRELPEPGWQAGMPVRAQHLWGLSESQETVGVSPKMFEEFVLPYQLPITNRFGLVYYGCCEPVHTRIKSIKRIPNLRRVSVSPWADQQVMAAELGRDYIFCRKPNPTQISMEVWDEAAIRADLSETLRIAKDCPLELVMKDVHTLNNQPWRLGRWVELAREEAEREGRSRPG